ncbi:MAG TPA: hypothetical protein VES70_21305 [Pseudomonas sp.]|nr:hypothetical protein [Pseudomonas sp.]
MDTYTASALKLQKNLLTLRQTRDRLRAAGNVEEADELALKIARVEETLAAMSPALKSPTLQ